MKKLPKMWYFLKLCTTYSDLRVHWINGQLRICHVWWQHKHGMVMECRFWHCKHFIFRGKNEKGGKFELSFVTWLAWACEDKSGQFHNSKIGEVLFRSERQKIQNFRKTCFQAKKYFQRKKPINPLDKNAFDNMIIGYYHANKCIFVKFFFIIMKIWTFFNIMVITNVRIMLYNKVL